MADRNIAIDRNIIYWSVYKENSTKNIFSIKYYYAGVKSRKKNNFSTTSA